MQAGFKGKHFNAEIFSISPKDYEKVIALFTKRSVDRFPAKWRGLGSLKIMTTGSREISIALYTTDGSIGAFKIDGTYYRGSTDKELIDTFTNCYNRVKGKKTVKSKEKGEKKTASAKNKTKDKLKTDTAGNHHKSLN